MPRKKPFIDYHTLDKLSPNDPPFVITRMDQEKIMKHSALMEVHRHGYYMLILCFSGTSEHIIDFEKLVIKEKQLGLIVPGQVHEPREMVYNDWEGVGIGFTADFPATSPLFRLPSNMVGPVDLPDNDFEQAKDIVEQMEREFTERQPNYEGILQHYLSALMLILQRNSAGQQNSPTLLVRYRELLDTHYLEWTKPAQYAEALHISVDYLNDIVKQYTGQTASSLISERRILEAKRLLVHATESIKEIAWHLQFNEVSYFNRFFKQHTGHTPAAFREFIRDKSSSVRE